MFHRCRETSFPLQYNDFAAKEAQFGGGGKTVIWFPEGERFLGEKERPAEFRNPIV
jgi:hypothetical protein